MDFFQLVTGLWNDMICHNKNVRLMMQNPSLGSLTEDPIDTSENLMLIQRFGQELSIYICFS